MALIQRSFQPIFDYQRSQPNTNLPSLPHLIHHLGQLSKIGMQSHLIKSYYISWFSRSNVKMLVETMEGSRIRATEQAENAKAF